MSIPLKQGRAAGGSTTTVTFDPERAKQFEIRRKPSFLKDRVEVTFSYYDIQVSNIVMEEGHRPFYYVQDGAVAIAAVMRRALWPVPLADSI